MTKTIEKNFVKLDSLMVFMRVSLGEALHIVTALWEQVL